MVKKRIKSDVFNGEDSEIGGDMPKKFLRILKNGTNNQITSPKDFISLTNIHNNNNRVMPGETFADYNTRLTKLSKNPQSDSSNHPNESIYIRPSLLATIEHSGNCSNKPIRQKRKNYLQKRKEKKRLSLITKKKSLEPIIHQSGISRPLRDVVKEPPKIKSKN